MFHSVTLRFYAGTSSTTVVSLPSRNSDFLTHRTGLYIWILKNAILDAQGVSCVSGILKNAILDTQGAANVYCAGSMYYEEH